MMTNFLQDKMQSIGTQVSDLIATAVRMKEVNRVGNGGSFSSVISASGRLAASVNPKIEGSKIVIYADDYFRFIEVGRKGGNRPPIGAIKQWIEDKHISPTGKISKDSLAFAIANAIAKNGTSIYRAGGSDLLEDIVNDNLLNQIQEQVTNILRVEITNEITQLAA